MFTAFVIYVSLIIITTLILAFIVAPRWGHRNIAVYIVLCSGVGSLTVMACKGFGLAIKESLAGEINEFSSWVPWGFLLVVVICVMVSGSLPISTGKSRKDLEKFPSL